jgi:hypothetical protein
VLAALQEIEIIQIAGILIAALAVLWGVYIWVQDKPKLDIVLKQNVHYLDGRVESEQRLESGGLVQQTKSYICLTIKNTGKRPTSLIETLGSHNGRQASGLKSIGEIFERIDGAKPPIKIEPGDFMEFRCEEETLKPLLEYGDLEIHLDFSHLKNPKKLSVGS